MHRSRTRASPSEVATELVPLSVGLGILTMALFPFAVPGLLVFVVLPLALVAVPALLLAALVVPPLWLARTVSRRRSAARVQRNCRETSRPPSQAVGGRPGDVMS